MSNILKVSRIDNDTPDHNKETMQVRFAFHGTIESVTVPYETLFTHRKTLFILWSEAFEGYPIELADVRLLVAESLRFMSQVEYEYGLDE